MPSPTTARSLLSLAIGGLLLLPHSQATLAKGKWDCRASTDGKGWDCLLDGQRAAPAIPAAAPEAVVKAPPMAPAVESIPLATQPAQTPKPASQPISEPLASEPGPATSQAAPTTATVAEPQPTATVAEGTTAYERLATAGGRIDQGLSRETCGPAPRAEGETPSAPAPNRDTAPIQVSADAAAASDTDQRAVFTGNVQVERADQRVEAQRVTYDRTTQQLDAEGDVYYEQQGLRFTGSSAHLELAQNRGKVQGVEYRLPERGSRGTADSVEIVDQNVTRYDRISYTTCRPDNSDWLIRARELTTDQAEGWGEARHATLEFKGVPFAYTPYITFPIDDRRKSGFLTPAFGVSDSSGVDLATPYYWNIAPDMDATITPRVMSKRGVLLGGEYRYLTESHEGQVAAEFLPSDSQYGKDRGAFSYLHQGRFNPRLTTDVDVNVVSDDDYLGDFGDSLSTTSTRHLSRRGDLSYQGDDWSLRARLQTYQTVDKTIAVISEPYSQLPQVLMNLNKPDQAYGLTYQLRNEYVYFDHDDKVKGHRLDLNPAVSLPLRNAYSFLTPKLGVRYTSYALQDEAPGQSSSPSRFLPILSVDGGLFFERDTQWGDRPLTQTLEPRMFYLLVPAKNQDDIPIFDSSEYDFSFGSLFRENRFSGADRVGDAHQVTLALTSRALDRAEGDELLRGSLGTILHFRDRTVNLPRVADKTDSTSSLVGEVAARISGAWSTRAGMQWNPHDSNTELGVVQLHYQPDDDRIANLAYRYREGVLEQTDFATRWPLTTHTHVVGRWDYSLREGQTMEAFGGLEYESCCWLVRLVGRRYVNDVDAQANNAIMLQLELKGLTSLGDPIDTFLERGILGYPIDEQ